jgi:AcrR family transcriptional regulator
MTKRAPRVGSDTRETLVQTAMSLFEQHGISNVSLRQITKQAGINNALMHYHIGSKEALYEEVISRVIKPINDERRELLRKFERQHAGKLEAGDVIRAWAEPLLLNEVTAHRLAMILRLHGDFVGQTNPFIRKTTEEYSRDTIALFKAALQRALPQLSELEADWRFYFLMAVVRNFCVDPPLIERLTRGKSSIRKLARFRRDLVENVERMMSAPGVSVQRERAPRSLRSNGAPARSASAPDAVHPARSRQPGRTRSVRVASVAGKRMDRSSAGRQPVEDRRC